MHRNRIPAAVCFALVLALRVYQHLHGETHAHLMFEPLIIALAAFLLPALMPVLAIERVVNYAAWDSGHTPVTVFYMLLVAACWWFFPTGRIARWFGTFDAFREDNPRRPLLVRGVAHALDALNKRLFGRQKTGGWA